jgi:hypothetical protein
LLDILEAIENIEKYTLQDHSGQGEAKTAPVKSGIRRFSFL